MFANVVGHQRVRELLARALERGSLHTAYLFTGPPGVGKRLVAAEFVRTLLCREAGTRSAPCGLCDSCRHAGKQSHPDWLVVTPTEKRKSIVIDQVRELGEWLAQSPAHGTRKAVLLDPADSLGAPAANALLKTLEEPPPGRVIVLVAQRAGALPPTVRSRCQQVSFGALSDEEVAEVLRRNGWPAQSARQAAALAEGSPGAALERDARQGQEATESVRTLLAALAAGERGAALAFAEAAGDPRERALASLRALIGFSRLATRQRLGDRTVAPDAVPELFGRMGAEQIGGLLASALETHRRLEGDRPPNAKLALATLLAAAGDAGVRQ
jgi:DNA polymerase-3 subunit delta'